MKLFLKYNLVYDSVKIKSTCDALSKRVVFFFLTTTD